MSSVNQFHLPARSVVTMQTDIWDCHQHEIATQVLSPPASFHQVRNTTIIVLSSEPYNQSSLRTFFTAQDWLEFKNLIAKWHQERGATSSITDMAMCDSYQRIIGIGPKAIPLILRELEDNIEEPDQWFWALQVLAGTDPVTDEERGDFNLMARSWLRWAANNIYAW